MRRRPDGLAVTKAENGYDYAGQDPVNGYDLDGTMLDKNGIGDCEIGSCGNTYDTNPTGIASAGHIAKGALELAGVGAIAVVGTGVAIDLAPGAISAGAIRLHIAGVVRIGAATEVARKFASDFGDMWGRTNGGTYRDKIIASLVYAARDLGKAGVEAVANIIKTMTRR